MIKLLDTETAKIFYDRISNEDVYVINSEVGNFIITERNISDDMKHLIEPMISFFKEPFFLMSGKKDFDWLPYFIKDGKAFLKLFDLTGGCDE